MTNHTHNQFTDVLSEDIYNYGDHFSAWSNLDDQDAHTTVRMWTAVNEDREILNAGVDISTHHSFTMIQKGRGTVGVYPSHPMYHTYDFPEVEVEPAQSDDQPIMGKIIASWDLLGG